MHPSSSSSVADAQGELTDHPNETVLKIDPKTTFYQLQVGDVRRKLAMVWADGRVQIYAEPEEIEERIKEVDNYQAIHLYPILEIAKLRRQLGIPLDVQEPMPQWQYGTHEA